MLEKGIIIYPRINSMELNMLCHGHSLKEGLFQTYPIDSVIDILSRNVYLKKIPNRLHINFDGQKFIQYVQNNDEYSGLISKGIGSSNAEYICITISDDGFGKNKNMLDKYLIPCGYFCSNDFTDHYESESEDRKYSFNTFIYEKKYDNDVTDNVFKYKKYLYHITLNKYVDKIFRQGLKPKNSGWSDGYFKSDNRIYLFTNLEIASDIFKNYEIYFGKKDLNKSNSLTLLQIDVSKLNETIKFYADPRQPESIYTFDNISLNTVELIDTILF